MRFNQTKLLHGLLYTAPVILLTLVACGGGGSSDGSLDVSYTVSGTASGLTSDGLVLLNNGGDAQTVASGVFGVTGFSFPAINTSYNVTILSQPNTPDHQKCTVGSGSGPRQAVDVSNVAVSCVDAYTISTDITNVLGTGLVLQNNGGDNMLVPASAAAATQTFVFNTPVINAASYVVSVLTQPHTPAQDCTPTTSSGTVSGVNVTVYISCNPPSTPPPADPYVYAANFGSANVSAYTSNSGMLSSPTSESAGSGPYSIAIDPASKYAYVANYNSDSISAYSIGASGVLAALPDVDAGTYGDQTSIATGDGPRKIVIHPSGKFAYVVNYLSNNVSAYSIDAATGALAKIDADGVTAGNQAGITTSVGPISITVDPAGGYVYVANVGLNSSGVCDHSIASTNGCITAYSIDATSGALTAIDAGASGFFIDTGMTPTSITVDPAGNYAYVTNAGLSNEVWVYSIDVNGALTSAGSTSTGNNPKSLAIHPGGSYAYVTNYDDGTVWIYSISGTGMLNFVTTKDTGDSPLTTHPFSISVDSTGQYAYVANSGTNDIAAFSITGGMTLIRIDANGGTVGTQNFAAGTTPFDVTTAR